MCHQTVSLVARTLEEHGLSTVVFSNARDITQSAHVPRTVFTNYPLGNPCGRPGDIVNQRDVLMAGLQLLETATESGTIVDTAHIWSTSRKWMDLILTAAQPFLSEETEARRKADLERARAQRRGQRPAGRD